MSDFRPRFLRKARKNPDDKGIFLAYNDNEDLCDTIDAETSLRARKNWGSAD